MGKTLLAACSIACALIAAPAASTTFPSLTTIYVIAGVKDNGGAGHTGTATAVQCSNVSGVTTSIRFLSLNSDGAVLGTITVNDVLHGQTIENSTKLTNAYDSEGSPLLSFGTVLSAGVVNIESTQSGVFCTAAIIDGRCRTPSGSPRTSSASTRIPAPWSDMTGKLRRRGIGESASAMSKLA